MTSLTHVNAVEKSDMETAGFTHWKLSTREMLSNVFCVMPLGCIVYIATVRNNYDSGHLQVREGDPARKRQSMRQLKHCSVQCIT